MNCPICKSSNLDKFQCDTHRVFLESCEHRFKNLTDAFDAAQAEVVRLRDGWIPVSERLPASDVWCLVVCNGIVQRQCAQLVVEHDPSAERVWVWQDWEADTCPQNGLSHWRPLPEPPEVQP